MKKLKLTGFKGFKVTDLNKLALKQKGATKKLADYDPDESFMDFNENEDFAKSFCGCLMKRRDIGGGTEFHMCDDHFHGPDYKNTVNVAISSLTRLEDKLNNIVSAMPKNTKHSGELAGEAWGVVLDIRAALRIIKHQYNDAGCDKCGVSDRVPGRKTCEDCGR